MLEPAPPSAPPLSLLLRPRLEPPPGTGGASPPGGLRPGMGGAPATGPPPPPPPEELATCGAERSLVTAFFSLAPFVMSPSSASWTRSVRIR